MVQITWEPILIFAALLAVMALVNHVHRPDSRAAKLLSALTCGIPLVGAWNVVLPLLGLTALGMNPLTFLVSGLLGLPGLLLLTVCSRL